MYGKRPNMKEVVRWTLRPDVGALLISFSTFIHEQPCARVAVIDCGTNTFNLRIVDVGGHEGGFRCLGSACP